MTSTDTAKGPSLVKAALVFAATAALLALSSRSPAQDVGIAPVCVNAAMPSVMDMSLRSI